MNFHLFPPSFGRAVAAGDACPRNQPSLFEKNLEPRPGSGSPGLWRVAGIVALLCSAPGLMLGQHRENRGSYSHDRLSSFTCSSASLTGAGTDSCTVTLAEATGSSMTVTLASSSSAVKIPASVTVASGASSAGFTVTASAVSSAQTATLTASDSSNSETYSLQLKATSGTTGTAGLTLGSTSVAFGDVDLNSPSTQTVKLTSSGTGSVTISAATIKGTGFTMSGLTAPVTLGAGQTATLDLVFDPTVAGTDAGTVTLTSNATSGGSVTIVLSGTGTSTTAYQVELNWDAPSDSSVAVSGYHIYRAPSGSTSYTLLNSSVSQPTTYTDSTVKAGSAYNYEVTSVDSSGVESSPSSVYTATVP
jgi:hypothetical protein